MPMPPHPTWEEVVAANEEVWALLGERPIESLIELPLMTDPDMKAVMERARRPVHARAFFTDKNLLVLHLCRMVSLSLRHGNTEAAVHGLRLVRRWCWAPPSSGTGRAMPSAELACALVERHDFSACAGTGRSTAWR